MHNELNRKKNHISDFHFSSYGYFCTQIPNFRWIFLITRKINIGKSVFHSIQHISTWKWDQNWGKGPGWGEGVCIYLVGTGPLETTITVNFLFTANIQFLGKNGKITITKLVISHKPLPVKAIWLKIWQVQINL